MDQNVKGQPFVEATDTVPSEGLTTGAWKVGLFDCFNHMVPNCFMSCCCSCVTFGQITARLGWMDFLVATILFAVCMYSGFLAVVAWLAIWYIRHQLRKVLQIPGSPLGDCCATFCCSCCALAQMATQTDSYLPGSCSFSPRPKLDGYEIV